MNPRPFAPLLGAALLLAACGGDDSASRADTVGAMTDTEVPARWDTFAVDAAALGEVAAGLCDGGDTASVGEAVTAARASWSELNPWWFGPVMDRRSRFVVDFDVEPEEIDALLAGTDPLDPDSMRNLYGADQRGLGAIDHVLTGFDEAAPDPRSCEFVASNAALVLVEADELAAAWTTFGPDQSTDDEVASSAIEAMVNESLFALAALREEVDSNVTDATLLGIEWAMVGDGTEESTGISALLDDDVVEQLVTDIDEAQADPSVENLMDVEITITTNIVSTLGLAIQFSDADGDG